MRLKKMTLENFRQLRYFEFIPDGQNAAIYGTNGAGKTTLSNALTWLLFDKSSTGEKGFSPKTIGADGKEQHHLEHAVEAVFLKDSGGWLTLKKVFKEKYTKKQGNGEVVYEGHVTNYYVDGVPSRMNEYKNVIKQLFCDEEQAKILTMPDYFSGGIPWQKRREILMEMAGGVLADEDVIASSKELQPLSEYMKGYGVNYSIEQLLKIAREERKKLLADKEDIPVKINEASRAIQNVDETATGLAKKIKAQEKVVVELEEQKASISEGEIIASLRKDMAEYKAQLAEAKARFAEENSGEREQVKLFTEHLILEKKRMVQKALLDNLASELSKANNQREKLIKEREELVVKLTKVMEEEWQGDLVCPTCGRELPEDKINEAKEMFNQNKSERKAALNRYGKQHCSKEMIAATEERIKELQGQITAEEEAMQELSGEADELEQRKKQIVVPEFEESEEYKNLTAKIAEMERAITADSQTTVEAREKLQSELVEHKKILLDLQSKSFILKSNERQKERIAQLEADEERISAELEEAEYKINLCEKFTLAKINLLTENINAKFNNLTFKLFEEQINGGYAECCEVMIPGRESLVPYGSGNKGGQINAGLEIIDALSRHWGMTMPVFIDNAESYVELVDIESQIIRLIVSAPDKSLRVVVDGEETQPLIVPQMTIQELGKTAGAEF